MKLFVFSSIYFVIFYLVPIQSILQFPHFDTYDSDTEDIMGTDGSAKKSNGLDDLIEFADLLLRNNSESKVNIGNRDKSQQPDINPELPTYFEKGAIKENELSDIEFYNPINTNNRRVFQGSRTTIKEFPFIASVLFSNTAQCGGAVIKADLVITAASCLQLAWNNRFSLNSPASLAVRVGSDHSDYGGIVIDVSEIHFHPSYNPRTLENNLAILRLGRKIKSNNTIRVEKIGIDKSPFALDEHVHGISALGWGTTSIDNILSTSSHHNLHNDKLDIYSWEECQEIYASLFEYVTNTNFCAGFVSEGEPVCNHDVGGPGVANGLLMGVISFGSATCGSPDSPTVFTKLGFYTDWINEIMEQPTAVRAIRKIKTRSKSKQKTSTVTFIESAISSNSDESPVDMERPEKPSTKRRQKPATKTLKKLDTRTPKKLNTKIFKTPTPKTLKKSYAKIPKKHDIKTFKTPDTSIPEKPDTKIPNKVGYQKQFSINIMESLVGSKEANKHSENNDYGVVEEPPPSMEHQPVSIEQDANEMDTSRNIPQPETSNVRNRNNVLGDINRRSGSKSNKHKSPPLSQNTQYANENIKKVKNGMTSRKSNEIKQEEVEGKPLTDVNTQQTLYVIDKVKEAIKDILSHQSNHLETTTLTKGPGTKGLDYSDMLKYFLRNNVLADRHPVDFTRESLLSPGFAASNIDVRRPKINILDNPDGIKGIRTKGIDVENSLLRKQESIFVDIVKKAMVDILSHNSNQNNQEERMSMIDDTEYNSLSIPQNVQNTNDKFKKAVAHILSHYSKQIEKEKRKPMVDVDPEYESLPTSHKTQNAIGKLKNVIIDILSRNSN